MRLRDTIIVCYLLTFSHSCLAESVRAKLLNAAISGLVGDAASTSFDWLEHALKEDGQPRPAIGVDLRVAQQQYSFTCADADYEFTKEDELKGTSYNFILDQLNMDVRAHNDRRNKLLDDYNIGVALLTGINGYRMRPGRPGEFDANEIPVDESGAAQCLTYPANHGLWEAQTILGFLYLYGKGVPKNEREYFVREKSAADKGFAPAKYNLALAYCYNYGLPDGVNDTAQVSGCLDGLRTAKSGGFPLASAALPKMLDFWGMSK